MANFLQWLTGREKGPSPRDYQRQGDLQQAKQLVDSSKRRIERASEDEKAVRQELSESHEQLKRNLEVMTQKLQNIRNKNEEFDK